MNHRGHRLAALALAVISSSTLAASFDCAKARSDAENLICADPELSRRDELLAELYTRRKATAPDKAAFKRQNVARWKQREAQCHDKACLEAWYDSRMTELQGTSDYPTDVTTRSDSSTQACREKKVTRQDILRVKAEIATYAAQRDMTEEQLADSVGWDQTKMEALVFGAELCGGTAAKTLDSLNNFKAALQDPEKVKLIECITGHSIPDESLPSPPQSECDVTYRHLGIEPRDLPPATAPPQ